MRENYFGPLGIHGPGDLLHSWTAKCHVPLLLLLVQNQSTHTQTQEAQCCLPGSWVASKTIRENDAATELTTSVTDMATDSQEVAKISPPPRPE